MATSDSAPRGLLLSDDLIFSSRIIGTASDLGLRVIALPSPRALLDALQPQCPRCVIVDLANPSLVIAELMKSLAHVAPRPFVVAYGSHVDTATLQAARDAGCDVVWPRSKFVAELPAALPAWFGKPQGESSSPVG